MRNIFILYMPPGNAEAMVHYEDTIRRKVASTRILPHLDATLRKKLETIFGPNPIAIWGSRDSSANRTKFDRMQPGDEVLIVEGENVKLLGRVAAKTISASLSKELWKNIHGGNIAGWDLIYFIANPREVGVPFSTVCELLGYSTDYQLRGFTAVSQDRLDAFYSIYDDLYSILVAQKAGLPIQRLPDPKAVYPDGDPSKATLDEAPKPEEEISGDSEHTLIQWMLLRMGRQRGGKVWAPRGDQNRIRNAHDFTDFEPTFAAGLDTQVKYLENIDVVWKEEFRIDAAFEVENSTSIYSGLLRFADLTMVAPNTNYPLFIVAPNERRNRVREQLARPSFKHLKVAEKVKFLSYDKVKEIDTFFGSKGKGITVDVFTDRAENLSTS
jgi:hypothetical protein